MKTLPCSRGRSGVADLKRQRVVDSSATGGSISCSSDKTEFNSCGLDSGEELQWLMLTSACLSGGAMGVEMVERASESQKLKKTKGADNIGDNSDEQPEDAKDNVAGLETGMVEDGDSDDSDEYGNHDYDEETSSDERRFVGGGGTRYRCRNYEIGILLVSQPNIRSFCAAVMPEDVLGDSRMCVDGCSGRDHGSSRYEVEKKLSLNPIECTRKCISTKDETVACNRIRVINLPVPYELSGLIPFGVYGHISSSYEETEVSPRSMRRPLPWDQIASSTEIPPRPYMHDLAFIWRYSSTCHWADPDHWTMKRAARRGVQCVQASSAKSIAYEPEPESSSSFPSEPLMASSSYVPGASSLGRKINRTVTVFARYSTESSAALTKASMAEERNKFEDRDRRVRARGLEDRVYEKTEVTIEREEKRSPSVPSSFRAEPFDAFVSPILTASPLAAEAEPRDGPLAAPVPSVDGTKVGKPRWNASSTPTSAASIISANGVVASLSSVPQWTWTPPAPAPTWSQSAVTQPLPSSRISSSTVRSRRSKRRDSKSNNGNGEIGGGGRASPLGVVGTPGGSVSPSRQFHSSGGNRAFSPTKSISAVLPFGKKCERSGSEGSDDDSAVLDLKVATKTAATQQSSHSVASNQTSLQQGAQALVAPFIASKVHPKGRKRSTSGGGNCTKECDDNSRSDTRGCGDSSRSCGLEVTSDTTLSTTIATSAKSDSVELSQVTSIAKVLKEVQKPPMRQAHSKRTRSLLLSSDSDSD